MLLPEQHSVASTGTVGFCSWKVSKVAPCLWLMPCTSSDIIDSGCSPEPKWFCVTARVPSNFFHLASVRSVGSSCSVSMPADETNTTRDASPEASAVAARLPIAFLSAKLVHIETIPENARCICYSAAKGIQRGRSSFDSVLWIYEDSSCSVQNRSNS